MPFVSSVVSDNEKINAIRQWLVFQQPTGEKPDPYALKFEDLVPTYAYLGDMAACLDAAGGDILKARRLFHEVALSEVHEWAATARALYYRPPREEEA